MNQNKKINPVYLSRIKLNEKKPNCFKIGMILTRIWFWQFTDEIYDVILTCYGKHVPKIVKPFYSCVILLITVSMIRFAVGL